MAHELDLVTLLDMGEKISHHYSEVKELQKILETVIDLLPNLNPFVI